MSIYSTSRNAINESKSANNAIFIEFYYNDNELIILTNDDVDQAITESAIMLEEGFPGITVKYNSQRFKVQLIPEDQFIGGHSAARVEIQRTDVKSKTQKGKVVTDRMIYFGKEKNGYKRGVLRAERPNGKPFEVNKNIFTQDAIDAAIGFVYTAIEDLEKYSKGEINRDEMQLAADNKFNGLSKKDQEKKIKEAKGEGSN